MELQELKGLLKESGIVGAGGAGFPTYAKLSYDVNTVILNGAECEPLFRVDQNLLATHTDEVLTGLSLVVEAVGAKEGMLMKLLRELFISTHDLERNCLRMGIQQVMR